MGSILKKSVIMTLSTAILLCGVYPALVWGFGAIFFPAESTGSLIHQGDAVIGSRLIAQAFTRPEYFHPRPSAAGTGYDGLNSSGSNLSIITQKFNDVLLANIKKAKEENPALNHSTIPNDMVMASGSGLDPDISPENALVQAGRVASARGIDEKVVKELVDRLTSTAVVGLLGDPTVNVNTLNLELDQLYSRK